MTRTRSRALIAVGTVTLLALTGCSSVGGGSTYDFPANAPEPASAFQIVLPDELRKAAASDLDSLLVDGYHITSQTLDGAELCALVVKPSYTDGALDLLTAPILDGIYDNSSQEATDESARTIEFKKQQLAETLGFSSPEEAIEGFEQKIREELKSRQSQGLFNPNGYSTNDVLAMSEAEYLKALGYDNFDEYLADQLNHPANLRFLEGKPRTIEEAFENIQAAGDAEQAGRVDESDAEIAEAEDAPKHQNLTRRLHLGNESSEADALDTSSPERGVYVSDDLKTLTIVGQCALSAFSPDEATRLEFTTQDGEHFSRFATVDVSLMTDGTIGVGGQVDDYTLDANGNWVAS